jgi:hypothetical protein
MFFEANNGSSYPLSRIARIIGTRWSRPPADCKGWYGFGVKLDDGDIVYVDEHERDRIFRGGPSHIWPAQPGTYLLDSDPHFVPESIAEVWPTPVIAWAMTSEGVQPVTVDGVNDGLSETPTILFPDGNVTTPEDRSWRSAEEWLRSRHDAARAKNARETADV